MPRRRWRWARWAAASCCQAAEVESALTQALQRGVLLTACQMVGAPNDTAKAEQVLRDGNGQTSKPVLLMTVASLLYDQSQLYTSDKLDDPQKVTIFCQRAQDALKSVPESKERKDLSQKIEAALKKYKRT